MYTNPDNPNIILGMIQARIFIKNDDVEALSDAASIQITENNNLNTRGINFNATSTSILKTGERTNNTRGSVGSVHFDLNNNNHNTTNNWSALGSDNIDSSDDSSDLSGSSSDSQLDQATGYWGGGSQTSSAKQGAHAEIEAFERHLKQTKRARKRAEQAEQAENASQSQSQANTDRNDNNYNYTQDQNDSNTAVGSENDSGSASSSASSSRRCRVGIVQSRDLGDFSDQNSDLDATRKLSGYDLNNQVYCISSDPAKSGKPPVLLKTPVGDAWDVEAPKEAGLGWVYAPAALNHHPPRLYLSASTVVPNLIIEKTARPLEEKTVRFRVHPSKVYAKPPPPVNEEPVSQAGAWRPVREKKAPLITVDKLIPLVNKGAADCNFTLHPTPARFFGLADDPSDPGAKAFAVAKTRELKRKARGEKNPVETPVHQLISGSSMAVAILFKPPRISEPDYLMVWPKKIKSQVEGNLEIRFTNGIVQNLPLKAELLRGALTINPLKFNFGSAHTSPGDDYQNPLDILLRNPSPTDLSWTLTHVPFTRKTRVKAMAPTTLRELNNPEFDLDAKTVDDPSVFAMSAMSGSIKAGVGAMPDIAFTAKNARVDEKLIQRKAVNLRVYFRPTEPVYYLSQFLFEVKDGSDQPNMMLTLRGLGSLEEIEDRDDDLA